ncbi:hypothetical protein O4H49_12860 [Kiloniella laminariae]|uniref:Uncharacterized protein n=1 Tax=Kiloniella laminariae TaxID=454162 RepID=A0ABT4LKP0_9PROT|nr:hypothetical protein [Kiloniella laminariae]MCZ4281673.1 hypothetical protein [Kiloniella laminariae]
MTSHLTDKRRRQNAFLPFMLEQVISLILVDSEEGLKNPLHQEELSELKRAVPMLKSALAQVKAERMIWVECPRLKRSLRNDYMELFQTPLRKRLTGYGFLVIIYICHQLVQEGADLSDNIIDAVNTLTPLAENGSNAKMIDGMKDSAWRMARKLITNLRRRDYLFIQNVGVAA